MKRLIISVMLAVALLLVPVAGALAATSQNVTVTATPSFISITNTPNTWNIGNVGSATDALIATSTTYYSNPGGATTPPSGTVLDGECRFAVTNTSTVATNIVVNFPDHTGGSASTNGSGTAGANAFAAFGYVSGELFSAKVTLLATGSGNLISSLAAGTGFKWGMQYDSQTGDWTSGDQMSSTVVMTATASG